jgi:hypothetical protein
MVSIGRWPNSGSGRRESVEHGLLTSTPRRPSGVGDVVTRLNRQDYLLHLSKRCVFRDSAQAASRLGGYFTTMTARAATRTTRWATLPISRSVSTAAVCRWWA